MIKIEFYDHTNWIKHNAEPNTCRTHNDISHCDLSSLNQCYERVSSLPPTAHSANIRFSTICNRVSARNETMSETQKSNRRVPYGFAFFFSFSFCGCCSQMNSDSLLKRYLCGVSNGKTYYIRVCIRLVFELCYCTFLFYIFSSAFCHDTRDGMNVSAHTRTNTHKRITFLWWMNLEKSFFTFARFW